MSPMQKYPVERFDPLLRDLLAYGLIEAEDGDRWALAPEVQQRLTALVATQRPSTAAVLHFGFPCARCHASGITRLHDGRHLCDACIEQVLAEPRHPSVAPVVEDRSTPAPAPAPEPVVRAGPVDMGERRLVSRYRGSLGATSTP